jgi:hypothetical protein
MDTESGPAGTGEFQGNHVFERFLIARVRALLELGTKLSKYIRF